MSTYLWEYACDYYWKTIIIKYGKLLYYENTKRNMDKYKNNTAPSLFLISFLQ